MQIRPAQISDAESAIDAVRRSIEHLCELDHKNDPATLSMWLANKTADNMRRWIADHMVLVAVDDGRIAGVASVRADGHVLLNYVAPEARFKGASKQLLRAIEAWASARGLEWLTLDSSSTALRLYQSAGWAMAGPPQPGFGVTTQQPMRKAVTAPSFG
jgi:GNAT superfamily N-acetyltransferase